MKNLALILSLLWLVSPNVTSLARADDRGAVPPVNDPNPITQTGTGYVGENQPLNKRMGTTAMYVSFSVGVVLVGLGMYAFREQRRRQRLHPRA